MNEQKGGLGKARFAFERDKAAEDLYKPAAPAGQAADQRQQEADKASKKASKNASVSSKRNQEDTSVTAQAGDSSGVPQPAPPPAKKREARVQFNNRIREDRFNQLDRYKRRHNTTMQAIVDQMVDEYLERRGLLKE